MARIEIPDDVHQRMVIRCAARIRAARCGRRLSAAEFAEAIGVAESTLRNWEAGLCLPRMEQFALLAERADLPTEHLLGISDTPQQEP